MLIFGLANAGPKTPGVESIPWYVMQIFTLIWGLCLIAFGSSRRSVISCGAGLRQPQKLLPPTLDTAEPAEPAEDVQSTKKGSEEQGVADAAAGGVVQDISLPNQMESQVVQIAGDSHPQPSQSVSSQVSFLLCMTVKPALLPIVCGDAKSCGYALPRNENV